MDYKAFWSLSTTDVLACITQVEWKQPEGSIEKLLPNITNGLIVQYGAVASYSFTGVGFKKLPKRYFAFPSIAKTPVFLRLPKNYKAIIIIFQPGIFHTLFSFPLVQLNNITFLDASEVISVHLLDKLNSLLLQLSNNQNKFSRVNGFFECLNSQKTATSYTHQAVKQIIATHGSVKVNELSDTLFMTQRTFERKFLHEQGVTASFYRRLVRCRSIMNLLHHQNHISMSELAYHFNYCDKAHLLNDFKKITGTTPANFLKTKGGLETVLSHNAKLS